jgi:glycerol-3-phosphate cytidylyltransferase
MNIEDKIIPLEQIEISKSKFTNKKIIFTNGCFDILHRGHLTYLKQAKELGDFLWIGLNSDTSVKTLKGPSRPINSEMDRAFLLACLVFVDAVTIFKEDTPLTLISKIKPNIHVKGGDYKAESLPEYNLVKSLGGDVQILPFVEGKSTTHIIQKIQNQEQT